MVEFILLKLMFLTISGTCVAFAMYGIHLLLQQHLSYTARYYMWLIPLLLFLIPCTGFGIRSSAGYSPSSSVLYRTSQDIRAQELATQTLSLEKLKQITQQPAAAPAEEPSILDKTAQSSVIKNYAWMTPEFLKHTSAELLIYVWLLGIVFLLSRKAVHTYRFQKLLKRTLIPPTPALLEQFSQYKNELGIQKNVAIKVIHAQISPFITGLLHPTVIFPSELETHEQVMPILYHELSHYKRHDLWYMQLMDFIKILHWFNPAVYWISRQIHDLMELSCDESVTLKLSEPMKKHYSRSIIMMMRAPFIYKKTSAHLSEQGQNVKKRLEVIMNTTKNKRKTFISLITAAVMLFASVSASAAINGQNDSASYAVNHLTDNGSFTYTRQLQSEDEIGVDDLTGSVYPFSDYSNPAGGNRDITLINTPFYKAFYASIKTDHYYISNGAKSLNKEAGQYFSPENGRIYQTETDEVTGKTYQAYVEVPDVPVSAQIEVRMDKFLQELNDGNMWNGLFSVSINGTVIAERIPGTIRDIPSSRNIEPTSLELYDTQSKKCILMNSMNFNVYGTDNVTARAALADQYERLITDPDTRFITLGDPVRSTINGTKIITKPTNPDGFRSTTSIYYNPKLHTITAAA